eukprot:TRINITY_DN1055_c0_g3_i2.p1 TRINITY_DN1055_c0_g3~~TRINITY_DN1055_c0_g3_i2.p1  ORF type:complete len:168 (-),score=28.30 TRINITY_DN1055_c0_g3_i2:218-721(-)
MKRIVFGIALVALICMSCVDGMEMRRLVPDKPLRNVEIKPAPYNKDHELFFKIDPADIKAGGFYEIRGSYPAVFPTQFSLEFVNAQGTAGSGTGMSRKLLNIEKIMFRGNHEGGLDYPLVDVDGGKFYVLKVSAEFDGVTTMKEFATRAVWRRGERGERDGGEGGDA